MAKPRIGLVTTFMDRRPGMGTAIAIRGLVQHLLPYRDEFEITLIHRESIPEDSLYREFGEVVEPKVSFPRWRVFLSELRYFLGTADRYEIIHFPYSLLYPSFVLAPARKLVVNLVDGGVKTAGEAVPAPDKIKWWHRPLLHRIDAAVAVSEFGRRGIIQRYGLRPGRVHTIYNGVDDRFRVLPDREALSAELSAKYGLPSSFIVCSGRLDPHKNILRMLEAYALLRQEHGVGEHLLILGGRHIPEYGEQVDAAVARLGLGDHVTIARIPDDADVPKIFNVTRCLVFPSLYEGFGLPLIEAMACGCPTVAARATSLAEVGGEATEFVDPYNPADIARGVARVLSDTTYAQQLVARGLERCKQFTWQQHAARTAELYRSLLG